MKKGAVVLWIALLLKSLSCSAAEEKDRLRDRWDTYPDVYAGFHSHSLGQKHDTPFPSYSSPGPHIHHFYDDPSGPLAPTGPSGLLPYGAPLPPIYGAPYSAPDHSFRGLDFAILCKIVLKVLIFKMIVKFIAVICVLLFLPKLDSGGSSGGDRKVLPKEGELSK
jgi:hypothetical protein